MIPLDDLKNGLLEKINHQNAVIGVVGLGYVGLPLMLAFGAKKFSVVGFDIDQTKIDALFSSKSYIHHIDSKPIVELNATQKATYTTDFSNVAKCDVIIICVPTPLTHARDPDMSYIINTAHMIAPYVREGQLFVLESTTYPGTTKEVLAPILEKITHLKSNVDFFVAFSPEREDPNNPHFSTTTIPKVLGADTPEALAVTNALYSAVIVKTVPVSSAATAEATKLMENIFRCVNIALVNELKVVFDKMGIDIWEVINAAKTKPFGFMPFYPGPGLGGHCIPIDPFYLTWKARQYECPTRFIELAGEINMAMPEYVVSKTMDALNHLGMPLKGAKILISGLAYKKNIDDTRESPAFKLWALLEKKGAEVFYFDPFCAEVPKTREYACYAGQKSVLPNSQKFDAIVVVTDHDHVDYSNYHTYAKVVVDTRNILPVSSNLTRA